MHTRHETHQQVDKSDDAVQHSYVVRRDGEPGSECDARQVVVDAGTPVVACAGTVCDRGRVDAKCQPADPRFFSEKDYERVAPREFHCKCCFLPPYLDSGASLLCLPFLLHNLAKKRATMSTYSCPVRENWFMSKYSEAKKTVVKTK